MALDVDPTKPIVRPAEARSLVEAVVAAEQEDETDWLEWKRTLTLTERPGCAALAREIIGFANRDPNHAATFVGGSGYIVVGAEPGGVDGVERLDPEKLDAGLRRFLGDNGPQWSPSYTVVDGKQVLLIKVEPPRQGDPIFSFRAETQNDTGKTIRDGTVFVRKGTRTEPASSADMDRLTARAVVSPARPADGPPVDVTVCGTVPLIWRPETVRLLKEAVDQHVSNLKSEASTPRSDGIGDISGRIAAAAFDGASYENWEAEVDEWAEHAWHRALEFAFHEITHHHDTSIAEFGVRVTNLTNRNLADVQVVLRIPHSCIVYDDAGADSVDRVAPPRRFGSSAPYSDLLSTLNLGDIHAGTLPSLASSVTRTEDDWEVRFDVGDVRPRDTDVLIAAYAFALVEEQPEAGVPETTPVTWTATSKDTDGVRSGTAQLVADRPISPEAIGTRGMWFVTRES